MNNRTQYFRIMLLAFSSIAGVAKASSSSFEGPLNVNLGEFEVAALSHARALVPTVQAENCSVSFADFAVSIDDQDGAANHSRLQLVCEVPESYALEPSQKLMIAAETSGEWFFAFVSSMKDTAAEKSLGYIVSMNDQASQAAQSAVYADVQRRFPLLSVLSFETLKMLSLSAQDGRLQPISGAYSQLLAAKMFLALNSGILSVEADQMMYRIPYFIGTVTELPRNAGVLDLAPMHAVGPELEAAGWQFSTRLSLPPPLGPGPITNSRM